MSLRASSMKSWPIMLPMPREPECNITHTVCSVSRHTSMKWLPPPRVPSCFCGSLFFRRGYFATMVSWRASSAFHRVATESGVFPQEPRSYRPRTFEEPCGTARSMRERSAASDSGRSLAFNVVCTAIMPQPISTPTAAGMMAPLVAITEPTVAPLPTCTSGITARCECTKGMRAMFVSCALACSSTGTPSVHIFTWRPPSTFIVS